MVDALVEAHRVLTPGGYLADLRPGRGACLSGECPPFPRIYALDGERRIPAGVVRKYDLPDHHAATHAVRTVLRRGLFTLATAETLPFRWHFTSLATLDRYLATRWATSALDRGARARLETLLRRRRGATILVEDTLQLNVLRMVGQGRGKSRLGIPPLR